MVKTKLGQEPEGRWKCPDCGAWVRNDVAEHFCYRAVRYVPVYPSPPYWWQQTTAPVYPYSYGNIQSTASAATYTINSSHHSLDPGAITSTSTYVTWGDAKDES